MKDNKKIIIGVIIAIAIVTIIVIACMTLGKGKNKTLSVDLTGKDQVKTFIDKVYENISEEMPNLATTDVDLNYEYSLSSFTGLKNKEDIDFAVASEPLMTGQAYSLVFIRVKDESKIDNIKQQILDNADYKKWICVSADKTYVTNYGKTVILLMASEDWADTVYESIDKLLGNDLGAKIEKNNKEVAF